MRRRFYHGDTDGIQRQNWPLAQPSPLTTKNAVRALFVALGAQTKTAVANVENLSTKVEPQC